MESSPSEKYLYDRRSSCGPDGMYPVLLQNDDGTVNHMPLRFTIDSGETVPFLDTSMSLKRGLLSWRLYNKREHMFVDGVRLSDLRNFPHIETKLSDTVKYGIVTSGLYRFAMINKMAFDFIREAARMVKKFYLNFSGKSRRTRHCELTTVIYSVKMTMFRVVMV